VLGRKKWTVMKTKLPRAQLDEHLREQLGYLKKSSSAYDDGDISEIKRLALAIRILVHEGRTPSLLSLLDMKNIAFVDTSFPYNPKNLLTHAGLIKMRTEAGRSKPLVLPVFDTWDNVKLTDFGSWWNAVVFCDKDRNTFTRRSIVLTLANQDGGAHVDESIDAQYAALRSKNDNMMGWVSTSGGKEEPLPDFVPPTVRQIAYEMIKTLTGDYPSGKTESLKRIFPNQGKIGRNNPCPCGSGKKYKKCCMP